MSSYTTRKKKSQGVQTAPPAENTLQSNAADNKREKKVIKIALWALFIVILASAVLSVEYNPDTDAYFLIENGRYIVENGIPHTNPWNINEGMKIVIQQPLCSVLNYIGYRIFGIYEMWKLAVLENAILLSAMWVLTGVFTKDHFRRINALTIFEACLLSTNFVTTRPYQLTMSISILELLVLFRWKIRTAEYKNERILKNENAKKPSALKYYVLLFLIAVLQANYQASFLIMLFLWPLCFYVPAAKDIWTAMTDRDFKYFKEQAKLFIYHYSPVYCVLFLGALCNPYGLDGVFYLFNASPAMNSMSSWIMETTKPALFGISGLLVLITAAVLLGKKIYKSTTPTDSALFYVCIGSSILTGIACRNMWMGLLAAVLCWARASERTPQFEERYEKSLQKIVPLGCIVIACCSLAMAGQSIGVVENSCHIAAIEYLEQFDKEDVVLYTEFNTGAMMEFAGYKVYMDARPELYTDNNTGTENYLDEWITAFKNENEEYETLFDKYGFTHFEVMVGSTGEYYLRYHDEYELIDKTDNYALYERRK